MTFCRIKISIHAPARGATGTKRVIKNVASYFNPRSREGSDLGYNVSGILYRYFNPRSREGSDEKFAFDTSSCNISIHAPARGATCSTPPKLPIDHISIHAPARGATCSVNSDSATFSNFNPRSREGSDYAECLILLMFHVFQSTLPRGERRHYRKQTYKILCDFNPRSREGSDVLPPLYVEGGYYISIHAPARGATHTLVTRQNILKISIHAPARGATVCIR